MMPIHFLTVKEFPFTWGVGGKETAEKEAFEN